MRRFAVMMAAVAFANSARAQQPPSVAAPEVAPPPALAPAAGTTPPPAIQLATPAAQPEALAPPTAAPAIQPAVPSNQPARPADKKPVLALINVSAGQGFTGDELSSVEEGLLSALEETKRFQVIGRTDLATMLDLETKKQLIGCESDTECMTSIAGSLGADYVASANVGRLGTTIQLTFKVIDARRAKALVHARETMNSDADLIPAADAIADQVVMAVFGVVLPPRMRANIGTQPWLTPGVKKTIRGVGIGAIVAGALGLGAAILLGVESRNDVKAAQAKATAPLPSEVAKANGAALDANVLYGVGGAVAAIGIGLTVAF